MIGVVTDICIMHTAIYLRVSTNDQSTASQEHELRAYCERHGWRDLVVYSDQISGWTAWAARCRTWR